MPRPEFPPCAMPVETIQHIREEQEFYDADPEFYERMEEQREQERQREEAELQAEYEEWQQAQGEQDQEFASRCTIDEELPF